MLHKVSLTIVRLVVAPSRYPNQRVVALTHPLGFHPALNPHGTDKVLYGTLSIQSKS